MSRTAVILFNLGGPDSRETISPFLFNFFMDPNIIGAPLPVRWLLAKWIAFKRSRNEAGSSYSELGYKSPLLENTDRQATALEAALGKEFKTFICMRYWHPMAEEVVRQVKDYRPDKIVLLPLYPQFSTTTTWSSLGEWKKAASDPDVPVSIVCCYPWQDGFIEASARLVRESYERAKKETGLKPRVLFSAHGLPEKIIRGGDPYQWQCEKTAEAIAARTAIDDLDWTICYQSRVGPLKWIGPGVEEELQRAARDNVPVVIYPHAFTQEHVETLVELDIEYRHVADELGIPGYTRVPTVSEAPEFIEGLARLVRDSLDKKGFANERYCLEKWSRCCQNMMKG